MRIVIDMQGAQTGSRFRGIGRYTIALVRGLLRNAGEHEIWLVLNGALHESISGIRADFAGLLPRGRIQVFECPSPVSELDPRFAVRGEAAELIREHFIAELRPDTVLVTSLFESYFEHAVASVGRFTDPARTAVILYDLIPFLNPAAYLALPLARTLYMAKIDSLRRASLLLAISDYARQEAIDTLSLDSAGVVAISTAVDETFIPHQMTQEELAAIRQQFGISRPMLMYAPGGYDKRKNLPGLINAWALLPTALRQGHQLVIASRLTDDNRADLVAHARNKGLRADEMVLTGYVSDDSLIGLYQCAALFIFPSLHEGFGLPALEAMACGAPVIGSNTTSLPEVIGLEEAMFDPTSPPAMAAKISQVLGDPALLARLKTHGRAQAARFSWDATARRALHALEANVERTRPAPLAPGRTALVEALARLPGIAKDQELLLELAFCLAALPALDRPARILADATTGNAPREPGSEPVVLINGDGLWQYRYAPDADRAGPVADFHTGDTLTGIDIALPQVQQAAAAGLYAHLHQRGVHLQLEIAVSAPETIVTNSMRELLAMAAESNKETHSVLSCDS
jgi:glycosyltransferase involved in cell wall biosynthesis